MTNTGEILQYTGYSSKITSVIPRVFETLMAWKAELPRAMFVLSGDALQELAAYGDDEMSP
jgi:hypothetical protein